MPKRVETKENSGEQEYTYDYLLGRIRAHIDEVYGGVANFLKHPDCKKCGFETSDKETAKMFTYLALPKEGNDQPNSRVRSFPVLQKLYSGLLGIKLTNSIKVERRQVITAPPALMVGA